MASNLSIYYVVQFRELPYENVDEFVIVPYSWVQRVTPNDDQVLVAYPKEKPAVTRLRVMGDEPPENEWNTYLARKIFVFDSLNKAYNWIAKKNTRDARWNSSFAPTRIRPYEARGRWPVHSEFCVDAPSTNSRQQHKLEWSHQLSPERGSKYSNANLNKENDIITQREIEEENTSLLLSKSNEQSQQEFKKDFLKQNLTSTLTEVKDASLNNAEKVPKNINKYGTGEASQPLNFKEKTECLTRRQSSPTDIVISDQKSSTQQLTQTFLTDNGCKEDSHPKKDKKHEKNMKRVRLSSQELLALLSIEKTLPEVLSVDEPDQKIVKMNNDKIREPQHDARHKTHNSSSKKTILIEVTEDLPKNLSKQSSHIYNTTENNNCKSSHEGQLNSKRIITQSQLKNIKPKTINRGLTLAKIKSILRKTRKTIVEELDKTYDSIIEKYDGDHKL